ncbi:tyrosine-type recombinase/integrase [Terricaulis sp.]|uniref:tyrosine-type recombinase/integrase n=1 Tax=Terricaulis sp. TaxID=2768686 RepID=UPI003782DA0E
MASNKLTKDKIERLKKRAAAESKTLRGADGEGLYIQAEANGGLYWRLAYRFGKPAKQKTLSFGVYPNVDLIAARKKRDAAKDELRAGRDPGASFKGIKFGGVTFGELAAEVLAKMERERKAEATIKKNRWLLLDLAAPLKDEPLADLDAPTIQALLEQIEQTGRYETAIRLRGAIGGVFRHAIRTARAEADPTLALAGGLTQPPVKHYAAVTDPKAVGRLLLAVESVSGARTVALAMKLLPLVFVRPGELRGMDWAELDRRGKRWVIPAHRTKSRREHVVPLSAQALAIFDELEELTGPTGFVFPNGRTSMKCMSEGALAAALASIGYDSSIHTPHGWRSTASTILNESGQFAPDVIEHQLAHLHADKVRAIYARGQHWPERVRMMTWYANELDRLRKRARQNGRFGIEA